LSNYGEWRTRHTAVDLSIDFEARRLRGSVELELESLTDGASGEIVLDSRFLSVSAVRFGDGPADWDLESPEGRGPYGAPLRVAGPGGGRPRGTRVRVAVDVETTPRCTALQWLTPAQTGHAGRHPFVFSQCQAIHARSLFPCQDTPDVKSTYSFSL